MKTNFVNYAVVAVISCFIGVLLAMNFGPIPMIGMPTPISHPTNMDHSMHDPMQMSMADMGTMLEGQTGDALDKAFLEGMIPHHQGAIDMAEFLVDAKHPELREMGEAIISAQQAEIDQMNAWLVEWGYKK